VLVTVVENVVVLVTVGVGGGTFAEDVAVGGSCCPDLPPAER
jgi:hypothetical protein